jgi:hypothetical protein
MAVLTSESPIALEHLDDHLKALLKVKLREFVHLSPCFADVPSIDVSQYVRSSSSQLIPVYAPTVESEDCPNRQHRTWLRRRIRHHAV